MRASERLFRQIEHFEGVRLEAYKCPAGVWTIGAGHTRGVRQGQRITREQAETLLRGDVLPIETFLNRSPKEWTQGQFDALVDFAFNLGVSKLENSTLWRRIHEGADIKTVQSEFMRWVYAGGRRLRGLERRRAWEARRYAEED